MYTYEYTCTHIYTYIYIYTHTHLFQGASMLHNKAQANEPGKAIKCFLPRIYTTFMHRDPWECDSDKREKKMGQSLSACGLIYEQIKIEGRQLQDNKPHIYNSVILKFIPSVSLLAILNYPFLQDLISNKYTLLCLTLCRDASESTKKT